MSVLRQMQKVLARTMGMGGIRKDGFKQNILGTSINVIPPQVVDSTADEIISARDSYHNQDQSQSNDLQEIFFNLSRDDHWTSCTQSRTRFVQLKKYVFRSKEGKILDEPTSYLQNEWFYKTIEYLMESVYYGYNVIFFKPVDCIASMGMPFIVDRRYVLPYQRKLTIDEGETTGISLQKKFDETNGYFFFVSLAPAFTHYEGLMGHCTTQLITKRTGLIHLRDTVARFAVPTLVITGADHDGENVKKREELGKNLHRSPMISLPMEQDVKLLERRHQNPADVFNTAIDQANDGISKVILGETMTAKDGSSRSQSETHLEILDRVIASDCRQVLHALNTYILPLMRRCSAYKIPEDACIEVYEADDPEKWIKIIQPLVQSGIIPKKEWIERTLGMPIEENPTWLQSPRSGAMPAKEAERKQEQRNNEVKKLYSHAEPGTNGLP